MYFTGLGFLGSRPSMTLKPLENLFRLLDSTEEIANIRTLRKKIRPGTY